MPLTTVMVQCWQEGQARSQVEGLFGEWEACSLVDKWGQRRHTIRPSAFCLAHCMPARKKVRHELNKGKKSRVYCIGITYPYSMFRINVCFSATAARFVYCCASIHIPRLTMPQRHSEVHDRKQAT